QSLETSDETPEQISDTTNTEETTDFFKEEEDEGPIALSDDEFDTILEEADEVSPEEMIPQEPMAPLEEELSLDELDEATPAEQSLETSDEISEQISDTPDTGETTDFFKEEEDEGPIALSDDEFDSILEETDEVAPEEMITQEPDTSVEEEVDMASAPVPTQADTTEKETMNFHPILEDSPAETILPPAGIEELVDSEKPISLSVDEFDSIVDGDDEIGTQNTATTPPPESQEGSLVDFNKEIGPIDLPQDEFDDIIEGKKDIEIPVEMDEPEEPAEEEQLASDQVENESDSFDEEDDWEIEIIPDEPIQDVAEHEFAIEEPDEATPSPEPEETIDTSEGKVEFRGEDHTGTPNRDELKSVIAYLDNLLGELPDDIIDNFSKTEYFKLYQKVMGDLGL
ncbi:MAG: hypothetical protein ABUK01_12590, partial [Leptospirales bacterium]